MALRPHRIFITLLLVLSLAGCRSLPPPAGGEHGVQVTLALRTEGASAVAVAGSFNHWRPQQLLLKEKEQGFWTITLSLPAGRYEYLFVVDGAAWVPDPAAPAVDDGLGGRNSVLIVPPD